MLFMAVNINAQTEDNPWQISIGVTAVDFYPVGNHEDYNQSFSGDNFEDFFNVSDHWNISPSVSYLSVGRYLKNNFSVNLSGAFNQIEKYGSAEVSKLDYFNLSARVDYSFSDLLNLNKFEPTIGIGGGYSWLEEGPFNSNGNNDTNEVVGMGSFNTTFGLTYWANDYIGLTVQSTHNYVMPKNTDVVQQHFRHSLGLTVRFGGTDTDDEFNDKKFRFDVLFEGEEWEIKTKNTTVKFPMKLHYEASIPCNTPQKKRDEKDKIKNFDKVVFFRVNLPIRKGWFGGYATHQQWIDNRYEAKEGQIDLSNNMEEHCDSYKIKYGTLLKFPNPKLKIISEN